MDHRLLLQQQADLISLDDLAEHLLRLRRKLLHDPLCILSLQCLQFLGNILQIRLFASHLLPSSNLVLLAHCCLIALKILDQLIEVGAQGIELRLIRGEVFVALKLLQPLLRDVSLQNRLLQVHNGDSALR